MNKILLFFILFPGIVFTYSCAKDTKPFKKVQYEVVIYPGNEVGIIYNSDYNTDNNSNKEIIINDDNNNYTNYIWSAVHIQKNEEPYYIKVNYKTYNNPQNLNYGVFVFVNDTLVDEKITNVYTPYIELTGSVFD